MTNYEIKILNTFKEKVNGLLKDGLDNKTVGNFIIGFAGGYDSAIDDFKAEISREFLDAIYEYGNSFLSNSYSKSNERNKLKKY